MRTCAVLGLLTLALTSLQAQSERTLHTAIARVDSVFYAALNSCDLKKYESFLTEDFESYHDKGGLTTSRKKEMDDMAIFCGEQRKRQPLRRELVKGTLSVSPIKDYGAIENCEHIFYLQIPGGKEKRVAKAKFTGVWRFENNTWQLARSLSYDHQPLPEVILPPKILESYEGNYKASDRIINIKREGSILHVTDINDGKPGWSAEILPEKENLFYLNYENAQFEFVKTKGAVVKLVIYENGNKLEEAGRQK